MSQITASDYTELATPEDPQLSPDGTQVAFLRKIPRDEEAYESTIYVVPTDGSEPPQRFSIAEGVDSEPRWSPSGDRIAFTSTRGEEDDRTQLWVLPTTGGEARQVTDVVGGVSSIAWSPDGTRIAFVQSVTEDDRDTERDLAVSDEYDPDDPDPRVIDRTVYRAHERYFDGRRSHVYLADLRDDTITRITTDDADYGGPEWGGQTTLYFTESIGADPDDSSAYAIHRYETDTNSRRRIHETTGWGQTLAATTDGEVAFPYTPDEQASLQQTELRVFDEATETVRSITETLDRTLGYGAAPQWGPKEQRLYFTTPDAGVITLWEAPGDGSEEPSRVVADGTIAAADVGGTERVQIAVSMSEWDHPGDVFHYTGDTRTRLTTLNESYLAEVPVSEPESITFESTQGTVEGWVLTPPEFDPSKQYPLLVEIHGGPHSMWSTAGTMWHEFQTLAARGYVVFWSNPRGSSGYGEEYMQAIERNWGDVTLTDVLAGVDVVTEREYVDETELFVTGGSFGGFMTAWTVGQTDRFTAAVSQRGVYDLTGFYGSTDSAYKLVEGDFDTTPWEEPQFLWDHSPVSSAPTVDTPTLLLHSEADYRTPIATAELFYRILRKHDVETRLVRYPREGHELSRSGEPGHIVDRIERIARWFDGYSTHHDASKALERGEDGLTMASAGTEDDSDGSEDA